MLFRFSLKHILFITFIIIASLPVLILAGWVEQSALDKEISSVEEKHLLVAKNLTGDLERYIIDVESSFSLISSNLIDGNSFKKLPEHLDSLFLRCIVIADNDLNIKNQVTGTGQPDIIAFNKQTLSVLSSLLPEAKNKQGKIVYSDLVRRSKGETVFYLVKALKENKFSVGILSTKYIQLAQKKVTFGRRGHAAIVDRTGRAIAHPIKSWVDTMKDMSFLAPVKEMKLEKTGVSVFYTPAMKADMVAGYTTVARVGWGVMIPQPFEELEERAQDVQIIALIIAITGIAISAMISWFIASILSDPIQSVVDATEIDEMGTENKVVSKVRTSWKFIPTELRILLNSFNSMRTKLNVLTSELHTEIDNTHKEIESQNKLLYEKSIELQEINKELKTTNIQLEILNGTDSLTGVYNRRHFDETLEKEFSYSQRNHQPFSLIMIDIDHFKIINDKYGHAAGDHVLLDIASLIIKSVRRSDIICRVGGEEFVIVCRDTNADNVRISSDALRNVIEQHKINYSGKEIFITVSIGASTYQYDNTEGYIAEDLYKQVDKAMYHSKNAGRNKTTHYLDIAD